MGFNYIGVQEGIITNRFNIKLNLKYYATLRKKYEIIILWYHQIMPITQKELNKYKTMISVERLTAFIVGDNDSLDDVISRYKNNIKISQALYPELSVLEVTLRNTINTMLCSCISPTWLEDEINKQNLLLNHDYDILMKAYNDLQKEYPNKMFTVGQVIAKLNFGFWTNLCSKRYNAKIWTKKGCFKGVFVNYPKSQQQQIHVLSVKLRSIRKLRNRIFHYEPIFKRPAALLNMYNMILEILSYLPCCDTSILKDTTTFLYVYNQLTKTTNKKT